MKHVVLALALVFVASVASAQQVPDPTSWTVTVFSSVDNSQVSTVTYARTDVTCGVDKSGPVTGTMPNPTEIRFDDWRDASKDCLGSFDSTKLPASVYYATALAITTLADGTVVPALAPSPRSNLFSRVIVVPPPATVPPNATTGVRIR